MSKLTKRVADAAEPKGAEYFLWCGDLPGFGLRVFPSGLKSYLVQYRAGGRSRRVRIGQHGPVTCEEARKAALALLGQVARGGDPAEERASRRAAVTVRELCALYMAAAQRGLVHGKRDRPKKPRTIHDDDGRIQRHIIPLLGNRLVREVTSVDVVRFIRDVTVGKTAAVEKTTLRGKAVVTGGRGTAARAAGLLGGILTFAVSEGIIERNPAIGVRRPADNRRERRLSSEEYRALGRVLEAIGAERTEPPLALAAVRLLALTGCRKGEVLRLRWSEVDAVGHALRLADTKEGASVRPVGGPALELLAGIERAGEYVLPGPRGGGHYGGLPRAWKQIRERAGLPKDVTLHTLRHSYASVAGDLGYSDPTIAALLGHSAGTMTGRYTHILDAVLVAAADTVATAVRDHLAGSDKPSTPWPSLGMSAVAGAAVAKAGSDQPSP